MSSFELRLTLIVLAVLAIIIMVVWYRGYTKESYRNDDEDFDLLDDDSDFLLRLSGSDEPEVSGDLREEFQDISLEMKQDVSQERMLRAQSSQKKGIDASVREMLVIMHVKAPSGRPFTGPVIQKMMRELGLEYGDMGVYHYNIERLNRKQSVFSVLNMVKPGNFIPDQMDTFTTPGLTLLLQLPGPEEGLKSFNIMLNAAERLATFMNGTLLDENRTALSRQNISHLKEQVQLFSLRNIPKVSGA